MIEAIKENKVFQQILKDSFGGIMYNADNINKYDTKELLSLWEEVPEVEKEAAGGIIKGVFEWLEENKN